MTGEKQSQKVGERGFAVQATGDATVNLGISTEEMRAIVETMADQLPKYAAIAAAVVEARLKTFEDEIIEKFDGELKEHRKAFEDPDFQYLLRSSQKTFARSGDEQTCENLVNLIGERSKAKRRDLVSLSLNTAVERAGQLSSQEFAALSYSFFWRMVRQMGRTSLSSVASLLSRFSDPLLPDVPRSDISYSYLEAIGCGKITLTTATLPNILVSTYPHLFSSGVPQSEIAQQLGDPEFTQALVDAGIIRPVKSELLVPAIDSEDAFVTAVRDAGLNDERAPAAWQIVTGRTMVNDEIVRELEVHGFDLSPHMDVWDSTPLPSFQLTAVGLAIGHANLKRVADFPADLSVWLKS